MLATLLLVTALLTAILASGYFWIIRNSQKYPTLYANKGLIVLVVSIAMEVLAVVLRS